MKALQSIYHLYSASTRGRSLAVQAGLRTQHITTVAITTACRNATHSANLHADSDSSVEQQGRVNDSDSSVEQRGRVNDSDSSVEQQGGENDSRSLGSSGPNQEDKSLKRNLEESPSSKNIIIDG